MKLVVVNVGQAGSRAPFRTRPTSWADAAHVLGQDRLRQTHQLIAMETARVFQTIVHTDLQLCAQAIMPGIHRKSIKAWRLTTAKHSLPARINQSGFLYQVQITAPNGSQLFRQALEFENIGRLCVQPFDMARV